MLTLPETESRWKTIFAFSDGRAHFQVRFVSFRECILSKHSEKLAMNPHLLENGWIFFQGYVRVSERSGSFQNILGFGEARQI